MKKYYAVQFWSGRNTTTGTPNEKTGYKSIACDLLSFSSKEARDSYVDKGKITCDMRGNCREAVTKKQARSLCLGMSVSAFNEHLELMLNADEF